MELFHKLVSLSHMDFDAHHLVLEEFFAELGIPYEPEHFEIIGSLKTGLGNLSSDINICLRDDAAVKYGIPSTSSTRRDQKFNFILQDIVTRLRPSFRFDIRVTHVNRASLPFLRLLHIGTETVISIHHIPGSKRDRMVAHFLQQYPGIFVTYSTLYYFLRTRELGLTMTGGIDPYALFMMICTALNHSSEDYQAFDFGSQLLCFLKFWGNADLRNNAFIVQPPVVLPKNKLFDTTSLMAPDGKPLPENIVEAIREIKDNKRFPLCLQDPASIESDLGHGINEIDAIQTLFKDAYSLLMEIIQMDLPRQSALSWDHNDEAGAGSTKTYRPLSRGLNSFEGGPSILKPLLAANYYTVRDRRRLRMKLAFERSSNIPESYAEIFEMKVLRKRQRSERSSETADFAIVNFTPQKSRQWPDDGFFGGKERSQQAEKIEQRTRREDQRRRILKVSKKPNNTVKNITKSTKRQRLRAAVDDNADLPKWKRSMKKKRDIQSREALEREIRRKAELKQRRRRPSEGCESL